ncbi:MAG TPA: PKD domain-containing protein, partial [bacterium]|nr:PKD domain-containing protein [bacterium]
MKPKNFYRSVLSAGLALCTTGSFSQSAPTASFSVSDTIGCSPLNIQFNNESANADSYYWDFGNGNTSILEDPSNMYIDPGTNTVTLIATSAGGQQDTIVLNDVIAVVPDVIAGFYATTTTSCVNDNSISFVNTSVNADYWVWDFGDGNTSSQQNPVHSYSNPGNYTIIQIAGNFFNCIDVKIRTQYIHIYPYPIAGFTVDTNVACDIDHNFSFTGSVI